MKGIFIACMIFCLFLTNCQKKEEQQQQTQLPPGPIMADNRIASLKESVKQSPKNLDAWIELGNIFMDTSRFQEAIGAYEKVLEFDERNVDVRVDMGTCYRNIGKPDRAVEEYRKAMSINPNHLNAHRNLGVVLAFDFKKKDEAIKEFKEYIRLAPNTPDAQKIEELVEKLKKSR